ncbi:MAG TPA: hypothetical protein ENK31_09625 [Nannocystis exedens]|nr:hypothetical protein [Nannocystis exedens]
MSRIFAHMPGRGRQDPLREGVRPRLMIAAAFVLSATAGCLSAYAPAITARAHHSGIDIIDGDDSCMNCHELESSMAEKMAMMDPATLSQHLETMETSDDPPLVQDWMLEEDRSCLACHRLRNPRQARR